MGGIVYRTKKNKIIIALLLLSFAFTGVSCSLLGGNKPNPKAPQITLTIWRLFDDKDVFDQIVSLYQSSRNNKYNITVNYLKKDFNEYEYNFTNALAAKQGPDILMLRNDWIPKHQDKLVPAPKEIITIEKFKEKFPDVVVNEVTTSDGQILGLPMSLDTLVLFYNTKHFGDKYNEYVDMKKSEEGRKLFTKPPYNWNDLITVANILTEKNGSEIKRAGVALGSAANISPAKDILSALILQNSGVMLAPDKKNATFNLAITDQANQQYYAGTKAVDFYTSFAKASSDNYTWSESMPDSLDAFIQGKASMIIDYPYITKTLAEKAPNLKYEIAPFPQIGGAKFPVDYASYWLEAVTNNSQNPTIAWDFLNYIVNEKLDSYLSATKRISPERVEVDQATWVDGRSNSSSGSPTKFQKATAQTWYKGYYPEKVNNVILDLISNVLHGQNSQNAIDKAASDVTTLLNAKPY